VAQGCSGCHADLPASPPQNSPACTAELSSSRDGRQVKADAGYIRDSILQPKRDIGAGYQPIMPSFAGLLDDGEIQRLTEYIRHCHRRR
jgi:cytochrome c oxidase subunit 2